MKKWARGSARLALGKFARPSRDPAEVWRVYEQRDRMTNLSCCRRPGAVIFRLSPVNPAVRLLARVIESDASSIEHLSGQVCGELIRQRKKKWGLFKVA